MFSVQGHEYDRVVVVSEDGEYCSGGGHTTEIPSCMDTNESRKRLLSLLPQGMSECSHGCHEVLVLDERQQDTGGICIYFVQAGWNDN